MNKFILSIHLVLSRNANYGCYEILLQSIQWQIHISIMISILAARLEKFNKIDIIDTTI